MCKQIMSFSPRKVLTSSSPPIVSEVKPKTARFFLRAALGLFYDMQGGELPPHEVELIKRSVGPPLYESDARIAAWLSLPALISEEDLYDYFDGTSKHSLLPTIPVDTRG
jgi:hypothetical protein